MSDLFLFKVPIEVPTWLVFPSIFSNKQLDPSVKNDYDRLYRKIDREYSLEENLKKINEIRSCMKNKNEVINNIFGQIGDLQSNTEFLKFNIDAFVMVIEKFNKQSEWSLELPINIEIRRKFVLQLKELCRINEECEIALVKLDNLLKQELYLLKLLSEELDSLIEKRKKI